MTAEYRLVEGDRVRLRPAIWGFSEEELRRRYRWSLDDVLQYWSGSIPSGRSFVAFRDTISERDWPSDGKRVSYAIYTRDDELIGMVSCYNIDRRRGSGELGIYLGERELWGKGFGTDAMTAFLGHLFHDLGFKWLYLHTYESNQRAQRSYLRAGFQMEEKRRRYSPRAGYHQEVRMTIAREAFEAAEAAGYEPQVAAAN
jgi:RimJ/RimL family protein N-acetyltransferase